MKPHSKLNSLDIRAPHLRPEWHPDNPCTFDSVAGGSRVIYKWICLKCGCVWECSARNRTCKPPSRCPECPRVATPAKSLATKAPWLEKEWHPNNRSKFHEVSFASPEEHEWVCSYGHSWRATPSNRTNKRKPTGCPECSGLRVSSVNSLETWAPHLESEWYSGNDKKFHEVARCSKKKCGWICPKCKLLYWAQPRHRAKINGSGCPECVVTRSRAEFSIFKVVKGKYPDAISGKRGLLHSPRLELDIYLPSLKKAIEYDGKYWHSTPRAQEVDQRKNEQCAQAGIQLLRTPETDYESDPTGTISKIIQWLDTSTPAVQ